jgi:chromosomal replication initiation ATPase DnaA
MTGRETGPSVRRGADIDVLVGRAFAVSLTALRAPSRGNARAAFARQVAIYLSCTGLGLTLTEAGALFGRDRTTVAHACRLVERRRDDPVIDATVGLLERAMSMTQRTQWGVRRSSVGQ